MSRLSHQDLQALQGVWEQVALEVDGILDPPDDLSPAGVLTTFRDDQFAVRTAEGALLLEGNFTLDALVNPKAITWTDTMGLDAGKQLPAIYQLEGDTFIFIAAGEGAPRPSRFHTTSGQTMRSFVRRR